MGEDLAHAKKGEGSSIDRINRATLGHFLGSWEARREAGSSVIILPGTCFVGSDVSLAAKSFPDVKS